MTTAGLLTTEPDGTDRRHLGYAGHVLGLKHSHTLPGGDDQASFTLLANAPGRPPSIRPGRLLTISLAGVIWTGRLDEPVPQPGGWQVQAHGQGTFGSLWQAEYSGTYDGDGPIDRAVTRGLPWVNDGINAVIDSASIPDSASVSIADHLSAVTDPVTRAWRLTRFGHLTTITWPTVPSRLLVLTEPAGRALADVPTRLWIRYLSGTDKYSTTYVENAAARDSFGVTERYLDMADAGVISSGTAQSRANGMLAKYQAAGWAGPFTATPGRYLTMTGAEVDLACERATEVVQPIFAGPASEGEWAAGFPPTFITGAIEYDWTTGALSITPAETVRRSLSDLMSHIGK